MQKNTYIAASILSADFAKLGQEVTAVLNGGADWIHIDIMDGHFVPNISFGSPIVKAIRGLTKATFDAHLMINDPDKFIGEFAAAGCDIITIHAENNYHIHRSLSYIKEKGKKAGLAINPATPINTIEPLLDDLDLILIMSVNPGFGGQKFIKNSLNKISKAKALIQDRPIIIEVDGGVNNENINELQRHGANAFVAGSFIYNSDDYAKRISLLRKGLQ